MCEEIEMKVFGFCGGSREKGPLGVSTSTLKIYLQLIWSMFSCILHQVRYTFNYSLQLKLTLHANSRYIRTKIIIANLIN